MTEEITAAEKKELEKLRKEKKMSNAWIIFCAVVHLIATIVVAVWMMSHGFSAKTSWIVGGILPSFIWWLTECPLW